LVPLPQLVVAAVGVTLERKVATLAALVVVVLTVTQLLVLAVLELPVKVLLVVLGTQVVAA
jgi:hypothetical protein